MHRTWSSLGACLLLGVAAPGCVIGDEVPPGCASSAECEPGFVCAAGACFRATTDRSPSVDAGTPSGDAGAEDGG